MPYRVVAAATSRYLQGLRKKKCLLLVMNATKSGGLRPYIPRHGKCWHGLMGAWALAYNRLVLPILLRTAMCMQLWQQNAPCGAKSSQRHTLRHGTAFASTLCAPVTWLLAFAWLTALQLATRMPCKKAGSGGHGGQCGAVACHALPNKLGCQKKKRSGQPQQHCLMPRSQLGIALHVCCSPPQPARYQHAVPPKPNLTFASLQSMFWLLVWVLVMVMETHLPAWHLQSLVQGHLSSHGLPSGAGHCGGQGRCTQKVRVGPERCLKVTRQ